MGEDAKRVFADNLRSYIKRNGKSQLDLAEYIGVSSSTVSDWCAGRKYPRIDKMQRIAEYFGITLSDITTQNEQSAASEEDGERCVDLRKLIEESMGSAANKITLMYDGEPLDEDSCNKFIAAMRVVESIIAEDKKKKE